MQLSYQANDDGFIEDYSPQFIIESMNAAMEKSGPYYAHIWYGPVSSNSPLLSFACFPGVGVYISFNLKGKVWIYVDSDDFKQSFPIDWGEDSCVIPRAYLMTVANATGIIQYFCETGTISSDDHWRENKSLSWNLYVDEEDYKAPRS
jgi:hypothetical protein